MDRAHRLGQRRAVSVFRLLTRGTIEERVQSLQRWKISLAGSLVAVDAALLSAAGGGAGGGAGDAGGSAAAATAPQPGLLQLLAEALPQGGEGGVAAAAAGGEASDDLDPDGGSFESFRARVTRGRR